ncbi:MAG: M48 family metallopeptidase [Planctomycetota bacterium]
MNAHQLDAVRFQPESEMLEGLFERFDLEEVIQHLVESEEVAPYHEFVLAEQLRMTPVMAPRIFRLFDEIRDSLAFTEQADLFVRPDPRVNAFALHRLDDDRPHVISLTSEMIKSMSDDEIRFAIGHEVGHLHYQHYRVMMVYQMLGQQCEEKEEKRIPRLLERRLDAWRRLSELSADRVGFLGVSERLPVAVSAFFKMASGLGPEHLRFDLEGFLSQLAQLQKLERREVFARFSHPVTPVRARALQLYAEAGGASISAKQLARVDAEVKQIANLMEFEVSSELGTQAREFLSSGGMLAAYADGEIAPEEQELLIDLLLQVTGDPEAHLERVGSAGQARATLDASCAWLRENAGRERLGLYGQLAHIVAVDGRITEGERRFMMEVAEQLAIPDRAAKEMLHEVLAQYLQTKAATKNVAFGFGR